MDYIYSLILGIVQGLTEFIPVSSSGHLIILHDILKFDLEQNLAFDTALHIGTGLAILIYFWVDFKKYIQAFFELLLNQKRTKDTELKIVFSIMIASIPAVIVGLFFEDIIENIFRSTYVVVITLITVAILFLIVERYTKATEKIEKITFGKALFIGLAQALALIPGVSRSGITICAGMIGKFTRAEAAKYSFLMGFPVIIGAGLLQLYKMDYSTFGLNDFWIFFIGFISSFVIGVVVIKFLMKFLTIYKLNGFAYYRIILAIILIIYLSFR